MKRAPIFESETKMNERKVYIGFVDDKPFHDTYEPYEYKILPVFTSRRAAERCFQDVRVFILAEIKPQKDTKVL